MIEKEITFEYSSDPSEPMKVINPSLLEKTAEYPDELVEVISNLKKKVDHLYVLVNALSAGEYFGPNRNGDYFPEKELIDHHKTYEELGYQYKKHQNKDPKKSFGKVIYSYFNPRMKRVEIIVEIPKKGNEDIIQKLEKGDYPRTSMGCKVPYDVCSVCGNKAKTRGEYCDHLKLFMGRTLGDGRRVYAINIRPKFFDSSWVDKPAELTAGVLAKVASEGEPEEEESDKNADIKKEIPAEIRDIKADPRNLIICSQGRIPEKSLKKIAEYNDDEILTTLECLRIMPTCDEFEKLGIDNVFDRAKTPNLKIAQELSKLLPNLVLTKPVAISRFTKTGNIKNEIVTEKYKRFVSDFNESRFNVAKLASENPWLLSVWVGDELGDLETQKFLSKEAKLLPEIMIDVPESYVTEGLKEFEGNLAGFSKIAEETASSNLFKYLSLDSLNSMYNSITNWEEN